MDEPVLDDDMSFDKISPSSPVVLEADEGRIGADDSEFEIDVIV